MTFDRWAGVFVAALGNNADAGFLCLKSLVPPITAIRRLPVAGYPAARRIEGMLRASCAETDCGVGDVGAVTETVIRFIALLVEKGRFRHVNSVIEKIEAAIDEQNGVLAVTLETAEPLKAGGMTADEFARLICEKTGAAKVRLETRVVPELLGGYRLKTGTFTVDASLANRIEKMKAALVSAALEMEAADERL